MTTTVARMASGRHHNKESEQFEKSTPGTSFLAYKP